MTERRRPLALLAGNSGWNMIAYLAGILANLITVPFVIGRLGISQFGVCGLLIALAAPLSLVGTTLGQSAAQGIARYRSRGDRVAVDEFCATIIALGAPCIAGAGVLLGTLAPMIARGLYPQHQAAVRSLWLVSMILALGWVAQQLSLLMQGVHVACQAYRRIATVNALAAIASPVLIIGIVSRQPDVQGYILALALGYVMTSLFWGVSIAASFRWSLVRPRVHVRMRGLIAAFTGWQMLAQLVANIAGQADRYLLGAWVSPTAVGYYNVAQRLEEVAYIGVLKTGDALFPQFSMNAGADPGRQAEIFFRASWMLNLVAAMVLAPLLPCAPSLLLVWVSPATSTFAAPVLQVLTVGGLLGCAGNVFSLYALGVAKTRYSALLSTTTAVSATIASVLLLRRFGFAAAGMGGVVGMLAYVIVMISLTRRHFGGHGELGRIATAIISPIGMGLLVAGGLAALGVPVQQSWPRVVMLYVGSSLLVMLSVILMAALTHGGRKSLDDLRRIASLPRAWIGGLWKSGPVG
jgi:O-antigen/teichoic acid export membrane protein